MNRNYASISPSALSLLRMKANTSIPFAKEAAALLENHQVQGLAANMKEQLYYWMRVFHFESRYLSIDALLAEVRPDNILELSSGYSFRGLDYCIHHNVHYIDTDLPELIAVKTTLQHELIDANTVLQGKLEMVPLNALDEPAFDQVVAGFGGNAFTIVNEGLLMYLGIEEKKKLCGIIHKHLRQKGGYWITADIYIQSPESNVKNLRMSKQEEDFFAQHNIDENKFESEGAAEAFFKDQGFIIDKVAQIDPMRLSSFHKLLEQVPEEVKREGKPMPRIQHTWRLRAV